MLMTSSSTAAPILNSDNWWQRLTHLPRDTRDTLFLLGLIAWVVMLLSPHIPLWCSGITALVLVWRGFLTWKSQPLPTRWWIIVLLVLTVGATLLTYRTIFGRDAGVTLIVVLLALKTLELRAKRDAFVVFFLALFTLLTHFSYSQSLLTAAGVLLAVWGLLTAVVNAHLPAGRPPLWLSARLAGGMALLGAPIMVVLFMFFPRIAPLWGVPQDALNAKSGLSEKMQVGQVAELAQDYSVAFRVRFADRIPTTEQMYFRGPVLSQFNGQEWLPLQANLHLPNLQVSTNLVTQGTPISYEVTLQPHYRPWLLLLDAAPQAPATPPEYGAQMTPDLQWVSTRRPVVELLRYQAVSYPQFQHGPLQREWGLVKYTELPSGLNPRTLEMAMKWQQESHSSPQADTELVQRALRHLATGGYEYTLSPGVYGVHSADEFWFDRKRGFCEHIAASFVILMRAMDIPARIITGYQGGEMIDGYWTVRQSDAHAWAEVWINGEGWQRIDPTAAVAPSRTSSFTRLEAPQGVVGTAMVAINPMLGQQLRAVWDLVNNRWNQWVLNYSQDSQLNLLKNIGFDSPSWEDLAYILIGILVSVSAAAGLWTLWERRQHDPWLRLLHRASQRMRQLGIAVAPAATPRQLAQLLQAQYGDTPEVTAIVTWMYALETWRYAPDSNGNGKDIKPSLKQLQAQWGALRWPAAIAHPAAATIH
jgi:transglutaminase-like putative cysteine protease